MTWPENRPTTYGLPKSSFRTDGPSDLNEVLRRPRENNSHGQRLDLRHMLANDSLVSTTEDGIALKQITNHLEANDTRRKLGEIIAHNCLDTADFVKSRNHAVHQPPSLEDHKQIAETLQRRYDEAATRSMCRLPSSKIPSQFADDQQFAAERVRQAHQVAARNNLRPPPINKVPEQFEKDRRLAAERVTRANMISVRDFVQQTPIDKIPDLFDDGRRIALERIRQTHAVPERNDINQQLVNKTNTQFGDDRNFAAEKVRHPIIIPTGNDFNAPQKNKIPAQFEDDRRFAAERVREASLALERNDLRPFSINKIPTQFEDDRSFAAERVRNDRLDAECNNLRPPPINKIPAQFEDDRSFAARRVRSEYAAEVRFFEKHDYGVAKEFEAVKSQIVDELAKEGADRRNELSREAELDRKRQELLEKKAKNQKRKKKSKSKKNERQENDPATATAEIVKATETTMETTENAIPAPPSCEKPFAVSFNAQRRKLRQCVEVTTATTTADRQLVPAPPSADKPREACYGAVNKNMVFYDPEQEGFVPAPPKTEKPKEGSFDRIRRIKAEVEKKASGEVEDTDKAGDGERNKNQTKIRKGSDGLSYLIDINTFRPSTSNRKLERAHAQVVSGQLAPRRNGEPVVMTWNATTAKRGVGFRSKLRKDGGVGGLMKDGDVG